MTDEVSEFIRKHLEGRSIGEAMRLEREADTLVKFGFSPDGLVVLYPGKWEEPQVVPESFLSEPL